MSPQFALWVANSVHAVSGIWPQHLCASEREYALTYAQTRMVERQGGFEVFLPTENQAFMRLTSGVLTNVGTLTEKQH